VALARRSGRPHRARRQSRREAPLLKTLLTLPIKRASRNAIAIRIAIKVTIRIIKMPEAALLTGTVLLTTVPPTTILLATIREKI
jgi:hypothetical protein